MKKRIIITNSSPVWGGNEFWAVNTARLLKQRGHHVLLLLKQNSDVARQAETLQVPYRAIPRFGGDFELPSLFRFYRIFKSIQPDTIIMTNTKDYWVCGLTAYLARVPRRILRLSIVRRVKNNLKYRLIYRLLAHRIIVNSREIEAAIRGSADWLSTISIAVLYNGLEIGACSEFTHLAENPRRASRELRLQFNIPEDAFVFGTCANITYRKRIDLLIATLHGLKDQLPAAHVVIIGKGNETDNLKKMAADLQIQERVHFLGYWANVMPLYRLFDVFVLTSQQEGLPNVCIQALADACPIIATDCGGVAEILDNGACGRIIPVNDLNALNHAMIELYSNEDVRRQYSQKGWQQFQKMFTAERMIVHLEKILDQ